MEDVKLVQRVSDEILNLVIDAMNGELSDITLGDLQGMAEATAMDIIKRVKETQA